MRIKQQKSGLVKEFIPINPEIKGIEVSRSGKIVLFAIFNTSTLKSEIIAAKFNQHLEIVASFDLSFNQLGKPRRLKRVKGTDIILIGMRKSLVVVDFNESENRFVLLKELDKVCKSDIVDFEFRDGMLFVKGYQEDYISVLNFNVE